MWLSSVFSSVRACVRQVRLEYHAYPDGAFRQGRPKVLRALAGAPALFYTPLFHAALEEQARRNIADEIGRLECP